MSPVLAALDDAESCTLIPTGVLSLHPLRAAPTGTGEYAADVVAIAYAPSARVVRLPGEQATADAVIRSLGEQHAACAHFACHGVAVPPRGSYVLLATTRCWTCGASRAARAARPGRTCRAVGL